MRISARQRFRFSTLCLKVDLDSGVVQRPQRSDVAEVAASQEDHSLASGSGKSCTDPRKLHSAVPLVCSFFVFVSAQNHVTFPRKCRAFA